MTIVSGVAMYFIFWWITLFALLPVGLRTQAEEKKSHWAPLPVLLQSHASVSPFCVRHLSRPLSSASIIT